MTKTPHISMEQVRANVVQRIVEKLVLAKWLRGIQHDYEIAMPRPENPGRVNPNDSVAALMVIVGLHASVIEDDIWPDIEQFASLFARDVLVSTVHTSGNQEPVVMLTGNSYMPAYRSFDEIERIWQEDESGVYIHELWEKIERRCLDLKVVLGYPEDDNCIYGVDLDKWEPSEAAGKDEPLTSLNDEWSWIDPEPRLSKDSYNPTGYRLAVESLDVAVSAKGLGDAINWPVGTKVKFRQPNGDTDVHTITEVGRDSDDDVWVRLEEGEAFFDWAEILEPA